MHPAIFPLHPFPPPPGHPTPSPQYSLPHAAGNLHIALPLHFAQCPACSPHATPCNPSPPPQPHIKLPAPIAFTLAVYPCIVSHPPSSIPSQTHPSTHLANALVQSCIPLPHCPQSLLPPLSAPVELDCKPYNQIKWILFALFFTCPF